MDNINKPLAVMELSNNYSIVILDIIYDINDYVVSAFCYDNEYKHKRKTRIFYDNNRLYFKRYGVKYYLDEFTRVLFY